MWRHEILHSSVGDVRVALLSSGETPNFTLSENSLAVPFDFAARHGLSVGDHITILVNGDTRSLKVANLHDGTVFGDAIVSFFGIRGGSNIFLYQANPGERHQDILRYATRVFPARSIEDVNSTSKLAQEIVGANYSPGSKARFELITFITIAYLSTSLLAFLERRKVLAILKSIGLRTRELVSIIAGENSIAPLLAGLMGAALSIVVLLILSATGAGLRPSTSLIVGAVLGIVPAVIIGIAVPARFTQMATVNQLLFERPIPLFYSQVKGLNRRYPPLEMDIARGVRFIRLDVVDGQFAGFIFRKEGDSVKLGEVIAVETDWAGLRVKEYVAPATGVIIRLQQETGFVGVMPENKLTVGGGE